MLATVKPYDPADSPGPIPSVVERFRPRADRPEPLTGPAAEAARYTVLLIPPESTDPLGHDRDDPGLKLYCDDEYDCDLSSLYEAAKLIEEQCKTPVTLIEHPTSPTGPPTFAAQPSSHDRQPPNPSRRVRDNRLEDRHVAERQRTLRAGSPRGSARSAATPTAICAARTEP